MSKSNIPFCTHTFNPVTGCPPDRHNIGCRERCWAAALARRFPQVHGGLSYDNERPGVVEHVPFSQIVYHPDRLKEPFHWRKPRVVFVCSLGDLFHDQVSDEFRDKVFSAIAQAAPEHTFLVFTKRAENMKRYMEGCQRGADDVGGRFPWSKVWLFVSCSTQAEADARVPLLLETPAAHRGVSLEPLLEETWLHPHALVPVAPNGKRVLEQVIVGCESGPGRRPAPHTWFDVIAAQCHEAGVPCYIKQRSENPDGTGRVVEIPPGPEDLAWRLA